MNIVPPLQFSVPALICNASNSLVYRLLHSGAALGFPFPGDHRRSR